MIQNAAALAKGDAAEQQLRTHCLALLEAMFEAVDVRKALHRELTLEGNRLRVRNLALNLDDFEHLYVVGFGKAAHAMGEAVEELLGERITAGFLNGVEKAHTQRLESTVASHPLPDEKGVEGARKILGLLAQATEKDLVLCLISGGGSALLPLPAEGVSLADKQALTRLLLESGASIQELNCVRKHLSQVKGGRLAEATKARILSLIVSDVIDDDLDVIASGPTAPDASTFAQAVAVLKSRQVWETCPENVRKHLLDGATRKIPETPKPNAACFRRVHNLVFLNNASALNALKTKANALGIHCQVYSDRQAGEAKIAGSKLVRELKLLSHSHKARPLALFAAGETTVTVRGKGRGGRNLELVLGGCEGLAGIGNALLCSVGTDGKDGSSSAAGALAATSTFARAKALGLDVKKFLEENNSHAFFEKLDDLIITGYTGTNVMDVQVLLLG